MRNDSTNRNLEETHTANHRQNNSSPSYGFRYRDKRLQNMRNVRLISKVNRPETKAHKSSDVVHNPDICLLEVSDYTDAKTGTETNPQ